MLLTYAIFAQADVCREAIPLSVFSDCQPLTGGTNRFIGGDTQDNTCGGDVDDDAWFRFTAISPFTRVTLSTDQVNDMAFVLFKKDCLTEIACSNEKGIGGQEIITLETEIDEVYFIQLYEVNEGWGPFLICVSAFEEDPDKKVYCDLDSSDLFVYSIVLELPDGSRQKLVGEVLLVR